MWWVKKLKIWVIIAVFRTETGTRDITNAKKCQTIHCNISASRMNGFGRTCIVFPIGASGGGGGVCNLPSGDGGFSVQVKWLACDTDHLDRECVELCLCTSLLLFALCFGTWENELLNWHCNVKVRIPFVILSLSWYNRHFFKRCGRSGLIN
jgi:hypothetical protein